jgi:hypothetical protein
VSFAFTVGAARSAPANRAALSAGPVADVSLGTSASAAPRDLNPNCVPPDFVERGTLWVGFCGPTMVFRNTNYTFGVVVKNYGKMRRKLELTVIHYDPITRSSIPYRRGALPLQYGDLSQSMAVWTLHNFKRGQFFRVNITLPFKQHADPKGSNFSFGLNLADESKDVIFKQRPARAVPRQVR